MRKKLLIILLIWFAFLWCIHVVQLNKRYAVTDTYYQMNDTFVLDGVEVTPIESHLFTDVEYEQYMNVSLQEVGLKDECKGNRIICIKLKVRNGTGRDISWDTLFGNLGYGFETLTWCSSISPQLVASINVLSENEFKNNAEEEIWLATLVNREIFREKTWKKIEQEKFYYVIDIQPNRRRICLTTSEDGKVGF